MKIQKILIAVMICAYGQISNASHDEDFIDPMDMEHYDQSSKSMKFTLKEKKSLDLFQGFLQGLLKSAAERGLKAVMDIDIGLEINKFLNNENWDFNKLQIILENVAFTENKGDLEKESVELFKGFLQRLLSNADERGLKTIMDIDINMEINKFLNNENWDSDKLHIILENVAFPEDKENCLWTLVVGGVILFILTLLMKIFYGRQPTQNEVINEEEPEDDNEYIEDQICTPTPETGLQEAVQYFRSERRSDRDTERNEKDKCPRQHSEKSHKFTQAQDENLHESHEKKTFISAEVNRAKTPMYQNKERAEMSDVEELSLFQTLEASGQNEALERVRSENQTAPDILQDEEDLYSAILLEESHLNTDQERAGQACMPGQLNYQSSSSGIMDDASVETDQTLSSTLSSEKQKVMAKPGANESADIADHNQELSSSDTEASSENQVKVDTALSAHHSQNNSMTVDDESDFIVLSENAPESLTFIRDEGCGENL